MHLLVHLKRIVYTFEETIEVLFLLVSVHFALMMFEFIVNEKNIVLLNERFREKLDFVFDDL